MKVTGACSALASALVVGGALGCADAGAPCREPLGRWEGRGASPPPFDEAVRDTLPRAGGEDDVYVFTCADGRLALQHDHSWLASTIEYYDPQSRDVVVVVHGSDSVQSCGPFHRSGSVAYGEADPCDRGCLLTASCGTDRCKDLLTTWTRCSS